MDVVLDSGGLTAWARRQPPADLLDLMELAARSGGTVVAPTVIVVESTTGRPPDDARANPLLRRTVLAACRSIRPGRPLSFVSAAVEPSRRSARSSPRSLRPVPRRPW